MVKNRTLFNNKHATLVSLEGAMLRERRKPITEDQAMHNSVRSEGRSAVPRFESGEARM